jgi:hypothetical protein
LMDGVVPDIEIDHPPLGGNVRRVHGVKRSSRAEM